MAAGTYNFTIEQGTTVEIPMIWRDSDDVPVPLTDFEGRMQVRTSVTDTVILLEMTSQDGQIIIGPGDGEITLFLTATETEAITWLTGVYDLELVSPTGRVTRLLKGRITVDPEVTR